jgi:NAD(P)-dependent dehydrogenase (short-subunit alcohol dehydrogenase family)
MRLSGKVAVVSGAGRGIGKGIALKFAEEGADVAVAGRTLENLQVTAREIKAMQRKSIPGRIDVRSRDDTFNFVETVKKEFGCVDILVNAAGVLTVESTLDLSEEDWDHVMDVNMKGTFLFSQAAARQMIAQGRGGKIICISSNGGKTGFPFESNYCASKHGVIGFVRSLALELARYKINVNAICPGYIVTDMHKFEISRWARLQGRSEEDIKKEALTTIPWGRFGTPEDIARVAVFLASEDSEYMTGQAINVTGGNEMH